MSKCFNLLDILYPMLLFYDIFSPDQNIADHFLPDIIHRIKWRGTELCTSYVLWFRVSTANATTSLFSIKNLMSVWAYVHHFRLLSECCTHEGDNVGNFPNTFYLYIFYDWKYRLTNAKSSDVAVYNYFIQYRNLFT